MPRRREPLVGAWLLVMCALVAIMILVGGATRLTDSGLSITEWNFAKQVIPPSSDAAWAREFELYRQTTEYQIQNKGMSLQDFQVIYAWEWGHRFLGKVIGVAFALPFLAFLFTGRLRGRLLPALALFALGGLQGAIGWWMVESGLFGRLDVAPYRLAVHLGMAFLILAGCLALALDSFGWPRASGRIGAPPWLAWAFGAALFVQVLAGALVAGSDAGPAYADWPTIGGEWFPSTYWAMPDAWRNVTENHAAVQFNHRTLGYGVGLLGLILGLWAVARGLGPHRSVALWVGGVTLAQMSLGIVALVHASPLSLSLIHQGGAVALWIATVMMLRATTWR